MQRFVEQLCDEMTHAGQETTEDDTVTKLKRKQATIVLESLATLGTFQMRLNCRGYV